MNLFMNVRYEQMKMNSSLYVRQCFACLISFSVTHCVICETPAIRWIYSKTSTYVDIEVPEFNSRYKKTTCKEELWLFEDKRVTK